MDSPAFDLLARYALHIAVAVVVLVVGYHLARRSRTFVRRLLQRPQLDQALSASLESILVRVAYYGILALSAIAALALLGVPVTAIASVSSAVLVVLAVALRESLANFAATVIFAIYQPFTIGEEIETIGRRGIVREIQLFHTLLRASDRSLVTLSNAEIQKSGIINYTRLGVSRVELAFTLSYEADVERARAILMDLMTSDPRVLETPPPAVVALKMGDNGLEMQARPFVRYQDYDPVQYGFREEIVARLTAAGIPLAVPQQEVRVTTAAEAG